MVLLLVVIHQLNFVGIAVCEPKDDPPVGLHRHRPKTLHVTLERVQGISGQVERLGLGCHVEHAQNAFDLRNEIGADAARTTGFVQARQRLCLKLLIMTSLLMCTLTIVSCQHWL